MIIKVKEKGYVTQPYIAPELTVFYNGKQVESIVLSVDRKTVEIENTVLTEPTVDFKLFKKDIPGAQGIQGVQGNSGIQGTSNIGTQGMQGIQGYNGMQGTHGIQGTTGTFNSSLLNNLSSLINMNIHIDENFLYVKVGNKVKRIPLAEF